MRENIFYWSPCLNPVGTVKSTINSAISLKKFNKNYDVSIINACGEWDQYKETLSKNSINLIDLHFKYYNCHTINVAFFRIARYFTFSIN